MIDQLYAELDAYSKFVIKKVRIELVKSIAAARMKRIDAGEALKPIDEDSLGGGR